MLFILKDRILFSHCLKKCSVLMQRRQRSVNTKSSADLQEPAFNVSIVKLQIILFKKEKNIYYNLKDDFAFSAAYLFCYGSF